MMRRRSRAGLAPLEMVLTTPLLMAVMALMVGFGAAASWKVRTAVVARHDAWRHHGHHYNATNASFSSGISSSSVSSSLATTRNTSGGNTSTRNTSGGNSTCGNSSNYSQFMRHGAMPGGPMSQLTSAAFSLPLAPAALANSSAQAHLFNSTHGVRVGWAHLHRQPPMLGSLGSYDLHVQHPLLHGTWNYRQMGLHHNHQHRIPLVYNLPGTSTASPPTLAATGAMP